LQSQPNVKQTCLIPKIRGFKIANLNITSLVKHIDELRIHMHEQELDVLGINETRLDSDYPTDLISIDGYTWIAKNRNRSGGV
jgi:exonuclease III